MGGDDEPKARVLASFAHCAPGGAVGRVLDELGLTPPRPALFVSGGALQLAKEYEELVCDLLRGIARVAAVLELCLVDGGTSSGVMALLGQARAEMGATFPLIGVLPEGILQRRGEGILDGNHSHFLLVDGEDWGAESGWLSRLVRALGAGRHPPLGLLLNGGRIAQRDIRAALAEGLPIWSLAGTGRLADALAIARATGEGEPELRELALSPALKSLDGLAGGAMLERKLLQYFAISR